MHCCLTAAAGAAEPGRDVLGAAPSTCIGSGCDDAIFQACSWRTRVPSAAGETDLRLAVLDRDHVKASTKTLLLPLFAAQGWSEERSYGASGVREQSPSRWPKALQLTA